MKLTDKLKNEYSSLFNSLVINPQKIAIIDSIVDNSIKNKSRYDALAKKLGAPWYFIAILHSLESSQNFKKHLHNGDPLTGRTKHVPEGRPVDGIPPFTWEESALDALTLQQIDKWNDWSFAGLLYRLEKYNGFGYRRKHPEVLSPYLWSFSNHYTSGKYVADGRWSDTAVSNQCGGAVLLRRFIERDKITAIHKKPTTIKFSNKKVAHAKELQSFLNSIPGIYLLEDGIPGQKTSSAFKKIFGYYLKNDPRNKANA